jgi:hypothetical protein
VGSSIDPWIIYTAIIASIGVIITVIFNFLNKPRVIVKVISGNKPWVLSKEHVHVKVFNKLHYPIKITYIGFKGQDEYGYTVRIEENPGETRTPKIDVGNHDWGFCLDLDENTSYTFRIRVSEIKSGKVNSGVEGDVCLVFVGDQNRNEYISKIPKSTKEIINK